MRRNPVSGIKADKTRLTVCFFCNADESSKLLSIIIGKSEEPRYFNKKSGKYYGCSKI
jgi:hypothetical protein